MATTTDTSLTTALCTQEHRIYADLCQLNANADRKPADSRGTDSECDVDIDYNEIARATMPMARIITTQPTVWLPRMSAFVTSMQKPAMRPNGNATFSKCYPRIRHMAERWNFPVVADIGQLVCLTGIVGSIGQPKLVLTAAAYQCSKEGCQKEQSVELLHLESEFHEICSPSRCKNRRCRSSIFSRIKARDVYRDYRKFTLLRHMQYGTLCNSTHGNRLITVVCCGTPARIACLRTGAAVVVVGIVTVHSRSWQEGEMMYGQLTMYANNILSAEDATDLVSTQLVSTTAAEIKRLRATMTDCQWLQYIIEHTCMELYGMWQAKYAIMLALVCQGKSGRATSESSDSAKGDGEIPQLNERRTPHILLSGDHQVGKSVLLRFAGILARKAITVSASATTAAGLTFAKSTNSNYEVEPGALVLANDGICCIDNINFFSGDILESLKDAMESQRVVGTFSTGQYEMPTRCSLICATHGPWRRVRLTTPFESRLDIILNFVDSGKDDALRRRMAEAQVSNSWMPTCSSTSSSSLSSMSSLSSSSSSSSSAVAFAQNNSTAGDNNTFLRGVATLAGALPEPAMKAGAQLLLQRYFDSLAARTDRAITNRYLMSLHRVAVANARLMLRPSVTTFDALMAIELMMESDSPIPLEFTYVEEGFPRWFVRVRDSIYRRLNVVVKTNSSTRTSSVNSDGR